jgi:hypothetical protein
MATDRRILSIVTASGCQAIYEECGSISSVTLVAWALVESARGSPPNVREIAGVILKDGSTMLADELAGFQGYVRPGESYPALGKPIHPQDEPSFWFA